MDTGMNEDTRKFRIRHEPTPKRGPWYFLTGLILGFLLGLIYTWWINPVIYESTHPASLRNDYKAVYRSTIAQVFAETGNLERASLRLDLLNDENPVYALGAQAQRALADGRGEEAHDLALLASVLQIGSAPLDAAQPTEPILSATSTIQVIPTQTLPLPTPTSE